MTPPVTARQRLLDDAIADLNAVLESGAAFSPRAMARALRAVLITLRGDERPGAPAVPGQNPVPGPRGERAPRSALRAAADAVVREALSRFERQDIDRWLGTGTLFQMRGDLAYLNLTAAERLAFDFREKLRDLGFSEELGLLEGHALSGEVLLFRRPRA